MRTRGGLFGAAPNPRLVSRDLQPRRTDAARIGQREELQRPLDDVYPVEYGDCELPRVPKNRSLASKGALPNWHELKLTCTSFG